MPGTFKHPLARGACLRPAISLDGTERLVLVIATTLELDPSRQGYKKSLVDKLARAIKEHLAHFPEVGEYILTSRPRDWAPRKPVPSTME
jgi:hypothetical protein